MATIVLRFDALTVSASSDDPADLAWLAEFLGPSVQTKGAESATDQPWRTIRLRADASLHARLTRRLPEASLRSIGFVMDNAVVDLPVWRDGDAWVAHDAAFEAFYRLSTPQEVEVIDNPVREAEAAGQPRRARGALMRVVREWVMNHARRTGHLALHAAGIARDGRALLFAGAKGAGKTTLSAACLLGRERWGLLANDRILLGLREEGWWCRGMASIVSVRPGSWAWLPELRQRIPPGSGGALSRVGEPSGAASSPEGRIGLGPARYAEALGSSLIAGAMARTVVFPVIDPRAGDHRCRRLTAAEAAGRIQKVMFAAASPHLRSELFEDPGEEPLPPAADLLARVAELSQQLEVLEIGLGPRAYEAGAIDRLLRSLVS